jgi:hypothetical protein
MQIRIPIAALLLSIPGAAQEAPSALPSLPQPFAQQKRQFAWPKAMPFLQPAKPPAPSVPPTPVEPAVCSIPLITVAPPVNAPKMPILYPPTDPSVHFEMKFLTPAPPCIQHGATAPQTPDSRP